MSALDGKTIGEFKILTKLGQGAMGSVYLAEQATLRRAVAVKVMMANLAQDPEYSKRFQREGMLAASLNHPNIVQVHTAGQTDDLHYLVMEYINGESLERKMARVGRLDAAAALDITIQLAEALSHAWNKANMIHRDVKPSNVLVSTTGEIKLADFGMAKCAASDSTLTATGMLVGTPLYISPEQARCDNEADFRTDIYSLGCTLFHMLCGKPPFTANVPFAIAFQHVTKPLPSIYETVPDCPPYIVKLVNHMVAKKVEDRPASYTILLAELRKAQELLAKPPRKSYGPAAVAALIVVAGAASYFGLLQFLPAPPETKSDTTVAQGSPEPSNAASSSADPAPPSPVEKVVAAATAPSPSLATPAPVIPAAAPATKPATGAADSPEAQIKSAIARLKEVNREFDPKTVTYTVDDGAIAELVIDITAITDLSPLKALPAVKRLKLGQTGKTGILESLEGLRGMTIRSLECHNTPVSDLSPLRGMPLAWFVCSGTRVSDLSPLRDCPLQALAINNTTVTDLSPISGMPLKFFNCGVTQVSDLTPLQGMPLTDLNCSKTPVRDLTPVAGLPLTRLICSRTAIEDLAPIRAMPLKEIDCDFNADRDGAILKGMSTLEKINGQAVADFWKTVR